MDKLWGAANVRGVGAGIADTDFLGRLGKLVGQFDRRTHTTTSARGAMSRSTMLRRDAILEVADLAAMPIGRAVLLVSGIRPTLVRLRHWSAGADAERVIASQRAYGDTADAAA